MKLLSKLHNIFMPREATAGLMNDFIYPYSDEAKTKREEIWQNLQKGILLEDMVTLVSWDMPFFKIDAIKEKRHDSADRTEWYLGKRTILCGYEAHVEITKYIFIDITSPIKSISENLGRNEEGMKKFLFLKEYLTDLLGEAQTAKLEKFGSFDLGDITWVNGRVTIFLTGFEQFDLRYSLSIGVTRTK